MMARRERDARDERGWVRWGGRGVRERRCERRGGGGVVGGGVGGQQTWDCGG